VLKWREPERSTWRPKHGLLADPTNDDDDDDDDDDKYSKYSL